MPRERAYLGIILKKQPLGEADELVTFYTKESGKPRAVVKSSKLPKSKLQPHLQPMFVSEVVLAGSGQLPKIIRANAKKSFPFIHETSEKLQAWYVAAELVLRATPDEESNVHLFTSLADFLDNLEASVITRQWPFLLLKFKIALLQALGVSVQLPATTEGPYFFSLANGGFTGGSVNGIKVSSQSVELFSNLHSDRDWSFFENFNSEELNGLISQYIVYHLEREIRSEKFFLSQDR